MIEFFSFASSSNGNAYAVKSGEAVLLIDAGLGYRTLVGRMAAAGLAPAAVRAVLLTHSHGDHVKGLAAFHRHWPEIPLYANAMTAETVIVDQQLDESAFVCFENGQDIELDGFSATAFSIPHDTSDPVGYLVRTESEVYFHGTDIGTPLESIGLRLREADIATLESNHDPVLLQRSGRHPSLIQRIAGQRGHLSNDQAAELVRKFASPRLRRLALAHLSCDCNTPHLAAETMRETLAAMHRTDVELKVLEP